MHGANEDEDQVPRVYNAGPDGDSGAPDEGLAERTASAQSCPSRLRCDFVYLLILCHHTYAHIRTQHTHTHNTHARHGRLRVVRSARQRCGVALLMQITRRLCAVCYAASEDVSAAGAHLNRMSLILPAAMLVQYRCRKY